MILSQSTDRTSSHSASFYLLFLTLGIYTTKGIKKNNNNNNNTRTMFMVLSSCCSSIARVHPGSRGQCTTAPGGRRPLDQADRPEP